MTENDALADDELVASESWLKEEYKLLTSHYFHEDSELKKTLNFFLILNVGLLGFAFSEFAAKDAFSKYVGPLAGLVLIVPWVASMVRIREFRTHIEDRIREIEGHLHSQWYGPDHTGFRALDIRTFRSGRIKWPPPPPPKMFAWLYRQFAAWPSSLTFFLVPGIFLVVWLVVVAIRAFVH